MSKELNYIIKRKNKIGKKLDNDQNLLETCGEYKSSDKQWFGWCEEYETLQSIENSLKALEIIKEKEVNVYMLKWYFTYSSYEQYANDFERNNVDCDLPTLSDKLLTQKEYDILKEVLL